MLYGNNINGEILVILVVEMICGLYGNKFWK